MVIRAFFVEDFREISDYIFCAEPARGPWSQDHVRADVRESLVKAWTQNESLSSNASFKTPRRRSSYHNSSLRKQCQHSHQVRHHLSPFVTNIKFTTYICGLKASLKRNFLVHDSMSYGPRDVKKCFSNGQLPNL